MCVCVARNFIFSLYFLTLNLLFLSLADFFVLMSQFYGIRAVLRLPLPPAVLVTTLAAVTLNLCTLYAALYALSLSHVLIGTLGLTLLKAVSVLLGQLQQLLLLLARRRGQKREVTSSSSSSNNSSTFCREYTRVVIFFSRNNRYLAKSLLPMLLVNCPSTALLISTLLSSLSSQSHRLHPVVQLLTVAVLLEQFLSIFLAHLLLANLNGHLRTLARRYISLAFSGDQFSGGDFGQLLHKQKTKHPQRERLLSCLFQERFHSRKPTGFTYFTFGYISRLNFVKVRKHSSGGNSLTLYNGSFFLFQYLLLYSELFMFVYHAGF